MAVAVFLGLRPTTGDAVNILSAERHGLFFVVRWQERPPSPDTFVAEVLTNPWLIERLERSDRPVIFVKEGARAYALPRDEYFAFRSAFPRCAAPLESALPPATLVYRLDVDQVAPFLEESPACAKAG